MSPVVARALTIAAVAVLAFDGAALLTFGLWRQQLVLALIGAVFFVSSGLLLIYWRWYQRRLDDIAATRRELRDEARDLQRALRKE